MTPVFFPSLADRGLAPEKPPEGQASRSIARLPEFIDFFEKTVDEIHAYILHCTRVPDAAEEMTLAVYFALLQRRRFFWWRTGASMTMLLALADREMAALPTWQEQATGQGYVEELLRCVQSDAERRRMRRLLQELRKLPVREQRLAVLHFFLRWNATNIAAVCGKTKDLLERELEQIGALLCEGLKAEERKDAGGLPASEEVCGILMLIRRPELSADRRNAFRMALLERCQTMPMSSMRFAVPAGVMVLALGIFLAAFLFPPPTTRGTFEQIAAIEVLLLSQEVEARNTFVAAERDLRGIAAFHAQGDALRLSLRLAPLAAAAQLEEEEKLGAILKMFGESALLRNAELVTYVEHD